MKVCAKRPDSDIMVIDGFENTLEAFQDAVDGYIECVYLDKNIIGVVNDAGVINGSHFNMTIDGIQIFGNIVFVNDGYEEFESLTDEQIDYLLENKLHLREWSEF